MAKKKKNDEVEVLVTEVPSQDLKEREDFQVSEEGVDREGNPSEAPVNKFVPEEQVLNDTLNNPRSDIQPPEEVHVMGHNVSFTEKVTIEPSNIFPPDEEPIPDVEDEGVDPDEVIDSLVTRKPFVLEDDEAVTIVGNTKVWGNPRAGQNAKNAAVRNVYTPKVDGEATNSPRISSTATGIHKKPATVKSVEGGRSGMFRIDKNRPIRN
jgi:hypothetical protein